MPSIPHMYPMKFVHREAWGALEAKDENFLPHPIEGIILTYTDTPRCLNKRDCYETLRTIQLRDMNRGYHDIKYNYLIGGDGYSYEGRGWTLLPPRSKLYPYLHGRVAIFAFIGFRGKRPPVYEEKASWKLIKRGMRQMFTNFRPTFYNDMN
ncbi:peptidoglycan-recognition protein 2-like [Macrosteles quadrilineatus]|uniref:peptidoglycan-recognition protein 2-like n=1 Tax=Macrosteles quadrilineatus TaxID=74068 RepID=UPI0023E34E86|nr:peptidoglycan-recognition protein 2-like [Macrosteles quadrilineatus]